jgi:flap endonuclease-1
MQETDLKKLFGRSVAIDASMSIYQFLIAMKGFENGESLELQNAKGEVTSHLVGLWSRTLKLIDEGVRPVYVFDGTPPDLKRKELEKRKERAAAATAALAVAKEDGDDDAMEKEAKRTVRLTKEQVAECKRLLTLMGLPIVQAEGEAEAQCVALVKAGRAWAVATEDMDALAFGAPILLRHLGASDAKKRPVVEYRIERVLQQLGFSQAMFIDLCILLGCDYCRRIPGVGEKRAFEGIQKYTTIEAFVESLDKAKFPLPEGYLETVAQARKLFVEPPVVAPAEVAIAFSEPNAEGLMQFLVGEKLFDQGRVEKGIERLRKALAQKTQMRLDSFFTVTRAPLPVHSTQLPQAGTRRAASSDNGPKGNAMRAAQGPHKKAVKK